MDKLPPRKQRSEQVQRLSLEKSAEYLLEESRMVLPGMQALFGFQLIVVFNSGFSQRLTAGEQRLHLLAVTLVAVAIAIIMTPAAYHRQVGAREVSSRFIRLSTRMLLWSMWPLALALCCDFYLVGRIILANAVVPALAVVLFVVFFSLWFVLPRMRSLHEPGGTEPVHDPRR
jgi:hypothetical protein